MLDVPGLILVTPLPLAHPLASQGLDCCPPSTPSPPLLLGPVQQLLHQHHLRITSQSLMIVTVVLHWCTPLVHLRSSPLSGQPSAPMRPRTKVKPGRALSCRHLPRPYLAPHITTITFHIPNIILMVKAESDLIPMVWGSQKCKGKSQCYDTWLGFFCKPPISWRMKTTTLALFVTSKSSKVHWEFLQVTNIEWWWYQTLSNTARKKCEAI